MTFDDALREIIRGSGTDFCPRCVDALEATEASGALEAALRGTSRR